MGIINRRNAVLGWGAWQVMKSSASRRPARQYRDRWARWVEQGSDRLHARGGRRGALVLAQEVRRGNAELVVGDVPAGLLRPALAGIIPYEPGKPVEEVQRELGLERVVKLASNEGPFGPFPQALEALEGCVGELNRYPDGGAYRLRAALAERHGVRFEEVAMGSGADGLIDGISQAVLDEGDQIVCGGPRSRAMRSTRASWARSRRGTAPRRPLRPGRAAGCDHRRTKIVYICDPTPDGHDELARGVDAYFERVPDTC